MPNIKVSEALDAFIKQKSIALMLKNWQNVQQMFNYSFAIHLLFIYYSFILLDSLQLS